jgi:hypothetical protein
MFNSLWILACLVQVATAASVENAAATSTMKQQPLAVELSEGGGFVRRHVVAKNNNNGTATMHGRLPSPEKQAQRRKEASARMKERRERVAKEFASVKPNPEQLERVQNPETELNEDIKRKLSMWGSDEAVGGYSQTVLADPSQDYDKWAQAYRMVGGFIDCDHPKEEGGSKDDNDGDGDQDGACSRWMVWASVS